MSTQTIGANKALCFVTTASAEIDVEISSRELNEAGWHHESECQGTNPAIISPLVLGADWRDAIGSLHRQAHPGQPGDPVLCREEPCRSLSADTLRRGLGRAS